MHIFGLQGHKPFQLKFGSNNSEPPILKITDFDHLRPDRIRTSRPAGDTFLQFPTDITPVSIHSESEPESHLGTIYNQVATHPQFAEPIDVLENRVNEFKDPEAALILGFKYAFDQPKNQKKALSFFQQAAKLGGQQGSNKNYFFLGRFLFERGEHSRLPLRLIPFRRILNPRYNNYRKALRCFDIAKNDPQLTNTFEGKASQRLYDDITHYLGIKKPASPREIVETTAETKARRSTPLNESA